MEQKPSVQSTGGGLETEAVFHLRERGIRNIRGKILCSRSRRKEFLDGEMQGVVGRKENVGDIAKGHEFHNNNLASPCHPIILVDLSLPVVDICMTMCYVECSL